MAGNCSLQSSEPAGGGSQHEHAYSALWSTLSTNSSRCKGCSAQTLTDIECLLKTLPQLVVAAALDAHVQQLLFQVASLFSMAATLLQEDSTEQTDKLGLTEQAAALLDCTAMWLNQNTEASQEVMASLLTPLAKMTDAALECAHVFLFSKSLLQVIGSGPFRSAADSVRSSVPVLCEAVGTILVLCWQGLEAAMSDNSQALELGCQELFSALHRGLLRLGVRAQEASIAMGPPEIKGPKNLNVSWKALTEIMCRKLPDYAKFVLVTEVQARQVVDSCANNLQTELQAFLQDPKPERINVLLFWLGHLKRVANCYGAHAVSPGLYPELLAAATRVYRAMASLPQGPCGQLLTSKVAPKIVDIMILLLEHLGSSSTPAAMDAARVHASAVVIEEQLNLGCLLKVLPQEQADAQLRLGLATLLKCAQVCRGLGPATQTALSRRLVPYLLKAGSLRELQQDAVDCGVVRVEPQEGAGGPFSALLSEVQAACLAYLLATGDVQCAAQALAAPGEREAFGVAVRECTMQLFMCATSPHPVLCRAATQVLCTACARCPVPSATQHLLVLASVMADMAASQAMLECSSSRSSSSSSGGGDGSGGGIGSGGSGGGGSSGSGGSGPGQLQRWHGDGCLWASAGCVGPADRGWQVVEALVGVTRHVALAAPLEALEQAINHLGLDDEAATSRVLQSVPDLAALASKAVLWEAYSPAQGAAAAASGRSGVAQAHQLQLQGRARGLLGCATQVHGLMSSQALSGCPPCLLAYLSSCLGWLLRALRTSIEQRQQPSGTHGPLLVQASRLAAQACIPAFPKPPAAGACPPAPQDETGLPLLPPHALPALQLAAQLAPCLPLEELASLAGGALHTALALPACTPYAMPLVAQTARLDRVPLPLFHAALRVAFQVQPGKEGGVIGGAGGAVLQHEAFAALATAFALLMRRNGSGTGSPIQPQALLLPGMMLDPASPFASSLRAYIKDQAGPAAPCQAPQAHAASTLLLDPQEGATLSWLLLNEPPVGPDANQLLLQQQQQQQGWGMGGAALQGLQAAGGGSGGSGRVGETSAVAQAVAALQDAAQGLAIKPAVLPHPGGLGGLAAEVGEQCARLKQHLDGIMAGAQLLATCTFPEGALGPAGLNTADDRLAGMTRAVAQLETEAATLASSCIRLAGMMR